MHASGSASNLVLALVFAVMFSVVFMGAVSPVAQGNGILEVLPGTAAEAAGLQEGDVITSLNGTAITSRVAFQTTIGDTLPNASVPMTVFTGGGTSPSGGAPTGRAATWASGASTRGRSPSTPSAGRRPSGATSTRS